MKLNKKEKEALFELLDIATDRCPRLRIDDVTTDYYTNIFWNIFKQLRLELKGY